MTKTFATIIGTFTVISLFSNTGYNTTNSASKLPSLLEEAQYQKSKNHITMAFNKKILSKFEKKVLEALDEPELLEKDEYLKAYHAVYLDYRNDKFVQNSLKIIFGVPEGLAKKIASSNGRHLIGEKGYIKLNIQQGVILSGEIIESQSIMDILDEYKNKIPSNIVLVSREKEPLKPAALQYNVFIKPKKFHHAKDKKKLIELLINSRIIASTSMARSSIQLFTTTLTGKPKILRYR